MDNKSLFDDLVGLVSREIGKETSSGAEQPGEQENILVESLKAFASQSSTGFGKELNEFLNGRGSLLETTRSAVGRSGSLAAKEVAVFIKETFNLPATMANTLAALLVKLFPSITKLTGQETTAKSKPQRKTKTSTSTSRPKKRTTSSCTTPKKKKTSESKKPVATAKPKKRKTSTTKKTAASSKTKKRRTTTRSLEIPIGEES